MNTKTTWLTPNLIGFGIASICSDASHEMVPLILPLFLSSLINPIEVPLYLGVITSLSSFTLSIVAFVAGKLTDRSYNRKRLIEIGYILEGLCIGLLGYATHWIQVAGGNALAWAGRGIIGSTRNASIAETTDPAYYGRAFGFRQAMDTLGSLIGPLIVYSLSGWPIQSLFFVTLVPATGALLAIVVFVSETPQVPQSSKKAATSSALPADFKLLLLALFLFSLGNFSKSLLILRAQTLLSPLHGSLNALSITTLLYSFRNIIQAIATYTMGSLSDRLGRTKLLALGGFLCFALMSILLMHETSNLSYLSLIFLLSGLSAGTTTSLEKSLAADLLPTHARGTGYGSLTLVQSIGALLASIVVGWLWTTVSLQAACLYAAFLSICSTFLLLFSNKLKK